MLSTIHASKGLEYDHVILILPDLPGLQPAALQQDLKDALVLGHPVEQLRDHGLFQLQIQFVIEAEEGAGV